MRLDLHVHSTASDGSIEPDEVVRAAGRGGLDVIALADHDTTMGVEVARGEALPQQVEVVPAIEVSSTWDGRDIHILGYFIDPDSRELIAHESRALRRREERMREMLGRLEGQGVQVSFSEVLEAAGPGPHAVGRPHLARAMVRSSYVRTTDEAFAQYIGNDHPAFVPTRLLSPGQAIQLVLKAGGIPVWAHPPQDVLDLLLPELVRAGLRGIEVYRPRNAADHIVRLEWIARTSGLIVTGGSDWHGPENGVELGDFFVSADDVARLLEEGGM